MTNDHLEETSTGGELILPVGGGSGSSPMPVYITNSSGTAVDIVNDGTYNRLCTDTELTVTGVTIDNVKVFSTDGTVGNAQYGRVDANDSIIIALTDTGGANFLQIVDEGDDISVNDSGAIIYGKKRSDNTALPLEFDDSNNLYVNIGSGTVTISGVTLGGGVIDATTQRVTLGTDDTAVTGLTAIKTAVEIMDDWDDGDNNCNVSLKNIGATAVSANSGNLDGGCQRIAIATDDVNLSAIKTAVELIDNAISGTEMQVDVVGALPAGSANIGKVVPTDGTTDVKLPTTVVDVQGASALTLLAASASNKHRIFLLSVSADTVGLLTVSDGIGKHYCAANGQVVFDFGPLGQLQDTANTAITITNSGGGNVAATCLYSTEAA
jgi:hypothetical protein